MNKDIAEEFTSQIIYRLDENTRMIMRSFELLEEGDIWKKTNESSNCIGNLVLHLCGNITQYAIASLGNKEDERDRDSEFIITEPLSKDELLNKLQNVLSNAIIIIKKCSVTELMRKRNVQGFNFSGIGILIHVTEHYSYHTGQIAFWTKQLKNKDLGFYNNLDLNIKNKD